MSDSTHRILAIGIDADHERIERVAFDQDVALADRALVLLDAAAVPALWSHVRASSDQRLSTNAETDGGFGSALVELVRRRRREASDLLRRGGTVVCTLRPIRRPLHVRRLARGGIAETVLHAYSWLPEHPSLAQLVITASPGHDFNPADREHPAWQLIRAQGDDAVHEAAVANEQLDAHWHVVATDKLGRPVAFEVAVGQGRLVFVPPVAAAGAAARGEMLVSCLAPEPEAPPPEPTPPPVWLADHLLPGEAELREEIDDLTQRLAAMQAELTDVRTRHEELDQLNKLLYASSAPELAEASAAAFERLGFDVEALADAALAIRCPEGEAMAACAAGTAAIESDPYWTLVRRFEAIEEPPHGIIVGNAFCDLPPDERGESFAGLLRRGADHRGLCLLASGELHAAIAALIEEPRNDVLRTALRQAILDATGPCDLGRLLRADRHDP